MYVPMHVCVYACMCMHACMYACTHVFMCECFQSNKYVLLHAIMCACRYARMYGDVFTYLTFYVFTCLSVCLSTPHLNLPVDLSFYLSVYLSNNLTYLPKKFAI